VEKTEIEEDSVPAGHVVEDERGYGRQVMTQRVLFER
jgi:hypothetical protein